MKEGAVTLSTGGMILFGNQRLGELLGAPLEKIVGTGFKRFFTQDQWPGLDLVMACQTSAASRAEFTLLAVDHSLIPISISLTNIELDEGAGHVLGAVITDLTEQRVMEERLSQAQNSQLLAFSRSQQVDLRPVDTTALILSMEDRLLRTLGADIEIQFASGYSDTTALNDTVGLKATVLLKPLTIEKLASELENAILVW